MMGLKGDDSTTQAAAPARRPVFLNLWQIRLPVAGLMSIAHRMAGVVLVLSIPLWLAWLELALSSPAGFEQARDFLRRPLMQLALFLLLWALAHHLLGGLRYLLLDVHLGVQRPWYGYSAWSVLLAAPAVALLLLWGLGS